MTNMQIAYRVPSIGPASSQRWIAHVRALLAQWRRRAQGRRELAALCDRCLRDIGLTRYDADRETRKPFWRA